MFLEWDEKYSVKVESLDNQHRIIFDIINELSEAIENGKEYLVLDGILDSMESYAKIHFLSEEKYMEDCHFPGLDEQKKQHQFFIRSVGEYRKKLKDDVVHLPEDIGEFLSSWWSSHILVQDMKYSSFSAE